MRRFGRRGEGGGEGMWGGGGGGGHVVSCASFFH